MKTCHYCQNEDKDDARHCGLCRRRYPSTATPKKDGTVYKFTPPPRPTIAWPVK